MTASIERYTRTAVILHWLIAFGVLFMFALGWYMSELPKDGAKAMSYDLFDLGLYTWHLAEEASPRTFYFNLHKSIGVTLLALILIRVLWRLTHRPPALLGTLKAWEKALANKVHTLLYLLMVAMPVSGLIMAVASKYGVKWFGLPLLSGLDDKGLREIFVEVHELVGVVFITFIALHILGALKHKFINKDDTLKRMSIH